MNFTDKVAIVTGASSGIGAATAVQLVKEGAKVTIVGRNEVKLQSVLEKCEQVGARPLLLRADLSVGEDVKRVIQETLNKFGKLDVLVNNAGIIGFQSILDDNFVEGFDLMIKTNLRSIVLLTTLAAPHLIQTKGNIVNVSSIGSIKLIPSMVSCCISKAGVDHFTRGAALELGKSGVRVNAVNPGPVRTDIMANAGLNMGWDVTKTMNVLERVSEPEELADLILFLASDKAKGITGSIFVSDNGSLIKV